MPAPLTSIQKWATSISCPFFVTTLTFSSSDDSSVSETNPDIQEQSSGMVQQENILVRLKKKERIHTPIKECDWRDNLILEKVKGVLPELRGSTTSPLGPTITSPSSSSSSSHFFPAISPNLISFCACNMLLKEEWQKSVSYMRGSYCIPFRDGTQHPSGPGWPCDKVCANLKDSEEAGCHFEFQAMFLIFWTYTWGACSFRESRSYTKIQCALPMPQIDVESEYNSFFTILQGTMFFSKKQGLPFLVWAPFPIHIGTMLPHIH